MFHIYIFCPHLSMLKNSLQFKTKSSSPTGKHTHGSFPPLPIPWEGPHRFRDPPGATSDPGGLEGDGRRGRRSLAVAALRIRGAAHGALVVPREGVAVSCEAWGFFPGMGRGRKWMDYIYGPASLGTSPPPTPWLWVCIVAPQYPLPPVVWVVWVVVGGGVPPSPCGVGGVGGGGWWWVVVVEEVVYVCI